MSHTNDCDDAGLILYYLFGLLVIVAILLA